MNMFSRFKALFEQSSIAIQIYNKEGRCVEVNDAWEHLFASKKSELEGYNVLEDPQVHETGVIDCFRRAFAGEIVHVPTTYYDPAKTGKTGRGRWLEAIFSPVKDENGVAQEVAILFNDITDLKFTQEELARSRDQLKTIFDHIPEAVILQDKNFKLVYANPAAVRRSGLSSLEEWRSMESSSLNHYQYFHADGSVFHLEDFPSRKAFAGDPAPADVVVKYRHKESGEERVSAASARAIYDEKGVPYQVVSVFRDITDKLRIETQLREALAAKDLFFSVASHELRTPMTALKLNTQLMHLTYPQVSLEAIMKVDRQVNKLSKLVDEMLDISRLARGNLELKKRDVNLSQLTREVLYGMMDQLKIASIPLTMNVADKIIGYWDPDRLEQVIENLVTNAIRYAKKSPLYVKVARSENMAILEVCDQGPGIPLEDHEKIFNRFEQSRTLNERSGLGLGLFIVKEIVTLHGGKISVSNLNTGGARFLIELPFDSR